jgi:hypothetical protein
MFTLLLAGQFAFTNDVSKQKNATERTAPELPKEISFAGEAVPLEKWEVKERLDREVLFNYYNTPNILFLLKLSNRYFPAITERLKANGVPEDFKYLCVAESNLLPNAISSAKAVSFWQFLSGTGAGFGLEVNSEVDERYHIEKATDAACQYLKQAYSKFGSWTAAAASYNCGQGGYNGQATAQKTKYYYDLLLPEETNRYLFRILAFKHLLDNASSLGFVLKEEEKYTEPPHRIVKVTSTISNLAQFALDNGTSYKVIRVMNPWLRGRQLTVRNGKAYELKLPPNTN